MSTFEIKAVTITIEEHPNADAIELARVGDYVSIVRKGEFKTGDLAIYIQEAAVVPQAVLERIGLWDTERDKGRLAGKLGTRVKAIKLRGILSQGLIYPLEFRTNVHDMDSGEITDDWVLTFPRGEAHAGRNIKEGDDVAEILGITKWEPTIPISMSGEVYNAFGKTIKFDIENIKRYPDVFDATDDVVITEKLHGTWCCIGYHPEIEIPVVTSKGLSDKGLAFKFNEANKNNLYVKAYEALTVGDVDILEQYMQFPTYVPNTPFYILGEIFGKGIQDLHYGLSKPEFRVFDIYVGDPGAGEYLNQGVMKLFCEALGLPTVPVLYSGRFDVDVVEQYTNGLETISDGDHMREGVVIHPFIERRHNEIGRVILKSVSEAYILRKGKKGEAITEYT